MRAFTKISSLRTCLRPCPVSIRGRQLTSQQASSLEPLLEGDFFKNNSTKRKFKDLVIKHDVSRDDEYGALLKALANPSRVEQLPHGVKAISLDKSQLGVLTRPFGIEGVGSRVLFERSFYSDLLATACGQEIGVALIGSAGTSKSTWLYWYVYKVVQAIEQGINLPSSKLAEGRPPPELIVYQRGSDDFFFFLTREKIAYDAAACINTRILQFFNAEKVVYLVEPLTTKQEPRPVPGLFTMIAASPDPIRYKEFLKTRIPLYMPTYEEEELVTIGKYLQGLVLRGKDEKGLTEQQQQAAELLDLHSEEAVRQRFRVYGGIIRRVLPNSKDRLLDVEEQLKVALDSVSTNNLGVLMGALRSDTLTSIGSHLVQWNPKVLSVDPNDGSKQYDFGLKTVQFASPQQYVFKYLSEKPEDFSSAMQDLPSKKVKAVRGKPIYSVMEAGLFYYPQRDNSFPAVEFYGKGLISLLYGIQASKIQVAKKCTNLALARFLEEIKMSPEEALSNLRIVYCRLHENSKWELIDWERSKTKEVDKTESVKRHEAEVEALLKKYHLHRDEKSLEPGDLAKKVLENVIYVDFDITTLLVQRKAKKTPTLFHLASPWCM
eukprot:gene29670-35814_t